MTEKKRVETIDLGKDPSLSWDIFKAAKSLEYLLSFTPQYIETLKAVRNLIATNIEVTDKQQKYYVDIERFSMDIIKRVREKEKEEEKDLPVIGIRKEEEEKE